MSDKVQRRQEEERDEGRQIRCEEDRKRRERNKWPDKEARGQEEVRMKADR